MLSHIGLVPLLHHIMQIHHMSSLIQINSLVLLYKTLIALLLSISLQPGNAQSQMPLGVNISVLGSS